MGTPRTEQIKALGKAVEDGLMSKAEAVKRLIELAPPGSWTEEGAADVLDRWRETDTRYGHGQG